MGNAQSQESQWKRLHADEYQMSMGPVLVFNAHKTKAELTQVHLPQQSLPYQMEIYQRRKTSKTGNLVTVYEAIPKQNLFNCANPQSFVNVITQSIPRKLSTLRNLSPHQAAYILEGSIDGFEEILSQNKVKFLINDKMIGLDESGKVKVWMNENYAANQVQNPIILSLTEKQMVEQLVLCVSKHSSNMEAIEKEVIQAESFSQAKVKLKEILASFPSYNRHDIGQSLLDSPYIKGNRSQYYATDHLKSSKSSDFFNSRFKQRSQGSLKLKNSIKVHPFSSRRGPMFVERKQKKIPSAFIAPYHHEYYPKVQRLTVDSESRNSEMVSYFVRTNKNENLRIKNIQKVEERKTHSSTKPKYKFMYTNKEEKKNERKKSKGIKLKKKQNVSADELLKKIGLRQSKKKDEKKQRKIPSFLLKRKKQKKESRFEETTKNEREIVSNTAQLTIFPTQSQELKSEKPKMQDIDHTYYEQSSKSQEIKQEKRLLKSKEFQFYYSQLKPSQTNFKVLMDEQLNFSKINRKKKNYAEIEKTEEKNNIEIREDTQLTEKRNSEGPKLIRSLFEVKVSQEEKCEKISMEEKEEKPIMVFETVQI